LDVKLKLKVRAKANARFCLGTHVCAHVVELLFT
jgi:hypothetical protein